MNRQQDRLTKGGESISAFRIFDDFIQILSVRVKLWQVPFASNSTLFVCPGGPGALFGSVALLTGETDEHSVKAGLSSAQV
jgi:hypothetical protein